MRFHLRLPLAAAALVLGVAGCDALGTSGNDVELRTDRSSYTQGRYGVTVELRLRNNSDRAIGYNLCGAVLERREGERWRAVEDEGPVCTAILNGLIAGSEARGQRTLLADAVYDGEYRFVVSVEDLDERGRRRTLKSTPFRVEWPED